MEGAKKRVAELESAVAKHEQTLNQSKQQVTDLTVALEQGKKGQEQLRSELTSKADQVAELEQKLEAALSGRAESENIIEKSNSEKAALEGQLLELKAEVQPLPKVS